MNPIDNNLSQIFSVSSSKSHVSNSNIETSEKPRSFKFDNTLIRATSQSPQANSFRKSILVLQRKRSHSPSKNQDPSEKNLNTSNVQYLDMVSEEVLQKKRNKHQENYISKQKRVFDREFIDYMDYQDALDLFKKSSGYEYKSLLNGLSQENQRKASILTNYEKIIANFNRNKEKTRENMDNLSDFYAKIAIIQNNEDLANDFLKELKEKLESLSDKTNLQLISQEQLENLYNNLKKEVSLKSQAYQDLNRVYELLENQNQEFEARVFPVKRKLEQLSMKGSQLGLDLLSDRVFQEEVLLRKQVICDKKQIELKDTILDFAETRKNVLNCRKKLKEQKSEIEDLEANLSVKKAEKVNNRSLLNALDYIDRISYVFIYKDPEDFDMESVKDLDKEPEKLDSIVIFTPKIQRIGSNRSITSGFSNKTFTEKRTFMNVIAKMKKSALDLNNSQMSIFINKRLIFTEKNAKKAGIERIERFYNKHNQDITGLFEKILNSYKKLLIEESSLKTRIEDLNEQKGHLFENFINQDQRLKEIFIEIPKEIRDIQILKLEKRELSQNNNEEIGLLNKKTLNQLKSSLNKKDDFMKTLNIEDIRQFQAGNMRNLLFLNEILIRFCQVIKAVFTIKAKGAVSEKDAKFLDFINRLSGKSLNFLDENNEENKDFSPKRLKMKKTPEINRMRDFDKIFKGLFPGFIEETDHCFDIISLDFILNSFTNIKDFSIFLQEFQMDLENIEGFEQKSVRFLDFFGKRLENLKENSQLNCLKKYRDLFEDFETFFRTINSTISQQKAYLKAMEKLENVMMSSMEELDQEIDSKKDGIEENCLKINAFSKEKVLLVQKRIDILQKKESLKPLNHNIANFSTDISGFEENDSKFLEKLNFLVKEELKKEEARFNMKEIRIEKPKRLFQKGFMQELKKNKTEIRELLNDCVHNNRKFSRILTNIVSEEKRQEILRFKAKLKDQSFWETKEICPREVLRKLHFLRPDIEENRPKTAIVSRKKDKKTEEKTMNIKQEVIKKRPVTGFLKVGNRSFSPRDLGISPPKREYVLMKETKDRGFEGKYQGFEGKTEGKLEKNEAFKGKRSKIEVLRGMYLGDFKRKKEGSV